MLTWRINSGKGGETGLEAEQVQTTVSEESKQILMALTELKTNVGHLTTGMDDLKKMNTMVIDTDQRARSAHNRLDDLKKDFEKKLEDQEKSFNKDLGNVEDDFKELKGHITWLWRTIGAGAIGLMFWFITNIDKFFN